MEIHDIALSYGGGEPGIRYAESLHYIVDKPFLVLFDEEQYPDPFLKAAVMMESLNRGHCFTDGNKRTGYLAGITLLELLVGLTVEADKDEVERVSLAVEAKELSTEELASWMSDHSEPTVNMWGENDLDPWRDRR